MDNTKLKTCLEGKLQGLSKEVEDMTSVSTAETLTEPTNSNYIALTNNALEIIQENLKNQPLSFQLFDIVKSPSGGSTIFSVPGLSGEEATKELTGIILDYATPRAYWDTPDPVEGTPPTCFSTDSIISTDGKACCHCPFNDFGSKDGDSNAKACKESVLLFLLRPNNIMPIVVRVPVTSKMIFLKYMTRLIGRLTPLNSIVTKITLEKATSKGGKPYALFHFKAINTLSSEETTHAKAFSKQFMNIVNAANLEPMPKIG